MVTDNPTIRRFSISAEYWPYPGQDPWEADPHTVTVEIDASSENEAALDAVLTRQLPVEYIDGAAGAEPVFWAPGLYRGSPWPEIVTQAVNDVVLRFGDENERHALPVRVVELGPSAYALAQN